jgi:TRAP-type C4-dicarboxylate transport system substrate-binding protein
LHTADALVFSIPIRIAGARNMIDRRDRLKLLCAALAWAAAPGAQAQATLTLSSWVPPTHPVATALAQWTRDVEQVSAGRVRVQTLPKAVATPQGHFNAVRDGLADVSFAVLGYTPGRFTLSGMAEMPLGGNTAEQNSAALQRMAQKYPAIMGEYHDVKVLALFTHGPGVIHNAKREIASLADMKGLKFRVGGGVVNDVGRLIEANTTLKPATESYELLSSGVMDGVFLPFESVSSYKLDKLLRHATTFPGGLYNSAFLVLMNKPAFDALPAPDRAAIDSVSGEALARAIGRAFDAKDREGLALAQASGIRIVSAPPAMVQDVQARIAPIEKAWIEAARAKGLANPEQVLQEFRAEARKP